MKLSELLVGAAVGAGLMYLLDPHAGDARRGRLQDQFIEAKTQAAHKLGDEAHQRLYSTTGVQEDQTDCALCDHVRAAIQRRVSYADSIRVDVVDGRATLYGPILAHDLLPVLSAARGVPGVTSVDSQLDIHHTPANTPEFHDLPARSLPSL